MEAEPSPEKVFKKTTLEGIGKSEELLAPKLDNIERPTTRFNKLFKRIAKSETAPYHTETIYDRLSVPVEENTAKISESRLETQPETLPPEVILEKVVEAAEHSQPIEKDFELRQEIKDESAQLLGATPVNAILAAMHPPEPQPELPEPSKQGNIQKNPVLSSLIKSTQISYAQGVKVGFILALTILLIAVMAMALT